MPTSTATQTSNPGYIDTWRVLHLVLLNTNLPAVGSYSMTDVEKQQSVKRANAFKANIEDFTDGMILINQDIVMVGTSLNAATRWPDPNRNSYWISPADLAGIMAANDAASYDAVIVYASAVGVPCDFGGLTVPGLSHIPIRTGYADGNGVPTVQPMAVTHEFSHQIESFMHNRGYTDFPSPDGAAPLGYSPDNDFQQFYDDWFSGDIPPPDGKPPYGISADAWHLGKPTDFR